MDTKYLNYMLTIAQKRSLTKAAKCLFISQSSLSQFLSRLEQDVGTPLFLRVKGEMQLTPAGELYVEAAKHVIQVRKDLYQNIQSLDGRGHITLGVTSLFGLAMIKEIIPSYKTAHPKMMLEITESDVPTLTDMLLNETIDCAVMALATAERFSPEQIRILREEEVFFAIPSNHLYCQINPTGEMPREDVARYFQDDNFLLSRQGSTLRTLMEELFDVCDFHPIPMFETNSILVTRSMVAEGTGVTLLAESCREDLENVAFYSFSPRMTRYNALVWRKNWIRNQLEQDLMDAIHLYFTGRPFL